MPVAFPSEGTPRGFRAVSAFLFFGTLMATLAAFLLAFPGTALDRLWTLNPRAHAELAPFGSTIAIAFLILALLLATAAIGWLRRRYWGWLLAVIIFVIQGLGDFANILLGDFLRGVIGFVVASAILAYLLQSSIRRCF
jgi:hypothetical protein